MRNIILVDLPSLWQDFKPITLTRPISEVRIGGLTIAEKWSILHPSTVSYICEDYLQTKYPTQYGEENLFINSAVLPQMELRQDIENLKSDTLYSKNGLPLFLKTKEKIASWQDTKNFTNVEFQSQVTLLQHVTDTFKLCKLGIEIDFHLLSGTFPTMDISDSRISMYGEQHNLLVHPSAKLKACILNTENGPIIIDEEAEVQEGSLIIGPVFIGKKSIVAFGAKIRPNTVLGPVCRVGGEVGNSTFHGYSNKAHDGFLGNSYLGEWCNLGANTNTSNLKNDYTEVKIYNYSEKKLKGIQDIFCGTYMGDYTKAGISTMFNTGTVVGASSNVFGSGFQEKYIPSFSWGGKDTVYETYRFDKAIQVIEATMARRELSLSEMDLEILKFIAEHPE
ncbi:MAG: putative sugar nucleotidyl transferase [Leadbetterella sp.]